MREWGVSAHTSHVGVLGSPYESGIEGEPSPPKPDSGPPELWPRAFPKEPSPTAHTHPLSRLGLHLALGFETLTFGPGTSHVRITWEPVRTAGSAADLLSQNSGEARPPPVFQRPLQVFPTCPPVFQPLLHILAAPTVACQPVASTSLGFLEKQISTPPPHHPVLLDPNLHFNEKLHSHLKV